MFNTPDFARPLVRRKWKCWSSNFTPQTQDGALILNRRPQLDVIASNSMPLRWPFSTAGGEKSELSNTQFLFLYKFLWNYLAAPAIQNKTKQKTVGSISSMQDCLFFIITNGPMEFYFKRTRSTLYGALLRTPTIHYKKFIHVRGQTVNEVWCHIFINIQPIITCCWKWALNMH